LADFGTNIRRPVIPFFPADGYREIAGSADLNQKVAIKQKKELIRRLLTTLLSFMNYTVLFN
jgi:hypothetical protein